VIAKTEHALERRGHLYHVVDDPRRNAIVTAGGLRRLAFRQSCSLPAM